MSTLKISRAAAIAAAAALSCSFASAADTLPMTVSASVVATCKLVTVPLLDFGTLNQVTAPAVNPAAVNVTYRCTKGTTPAITLGAALSASPFTGSLSNGTDTIAYAITWTNPGATLTGFGGSALSVGLTGAIAASIYQNVTAGTYTQTVAVNITP